MSRGLGKGSYAVFKRERGEWNARVVVSALRPGHVV
jgi:hypothetical protein